MATAKQAASKTAAVKAAAPASKAAKATKAAPPKAPTKTASAKPAAPKPASAAKAKSKRVGHVVPEEQRAHYIEVAAFYIAERRGFAPGDPLEDWLAAEVEINRLLAEGRLGG